MPEPRDPLLKVLTCFKNLNQRVQLRFADAEFRRRRRGPGAGRARPRPPAETTRQGVGFTIGFEG
jgi:hypothetical protein